MSLAAKPNLMRSCIGSIAMLMVATATCQGATPVKEPFFFFVLADPQLGMYSGNKGFERETKNLETVITAANKLHPAFVIVCGDLINKPEDQAQIDGYLRSIRRLDPQIPLYNVAGNHDVGNAPTPSLLAAYHRIFGPDHYSFRVDDLEGIVLDSQLISNSSKALEEALQQKAWLKAALTEARGQNVRHIVVFQHIPWFLSSPTEETKYYSPIEPINIHRPVRPYYLQLFHHFGVHYLIAGHYHRNARGTDGNIQMIINGPVGRPLGKDPSGFGIVVVRESRLDYKYVPLTSIPARVDLSESKTEQGRGRYVVP
jgi:serine/threonine-protein phosphatase CPPED1